MPLVTEKVPPQSFSPVSVSVAVPSRMPPAAFVMDCATVTAVAGVNSTGPVAAAVQSASAKNGSALSMREEPSVRLKSVPVSL